MGKKTYGYAPHKNDVLKRISRAEGQVRGIGKMVEDDTYCIDVLTQISAARSALDKIAVELIRDHANNCMVDADSDDEKRLKADELATAIGRII